MEARSPRLTRRRLLAAAGAAALAGCAATGSSGRSLGRVVVVGGGFGGASAARHLRLLANVEVTLVERWMLIIAGLMLVYPAPLFDYIGFALVAAVVMIQKMRHPAVAPATP